MPPMQSIEGLASNLNTTEIIDAIIKAERQPATILEEQQVSKTQEITTFKALAAKLLALQTSIGALNNQKNFSQASISVSNESILSATAQAAVGAGMYTLNVLSLARNHQIASQGFDQATQSVFGTGTISLALGNKAPTQITIDEENNSLIGIKDAINDARLGITATIINDGSSSNPYRLILTGNETGVQNKISVSGSLSGGLDLDFETVSFDVPETDGFSIDATSQVSLGATAAYTGTTNKTFTFTIAGSGAQTVGVGNITIGWTDGTDSGSIVVSQADTEIIGPEGLKLSFADGTLVGGDTFTVSTFAPLLQEAADAKVSIGSSEGGASPIIIHSGTNSVQDAIPGLTLDLKAVTTAESGPVTIKTGHDTAAITKLVNNFITAYNDVTEFIDDQNSFDPETEKGGVLMGDITLRTIQARLARLISTPVKGLDRTMNALSAIGIRTGFDGKLALKSPSKLTEAMNEDYTTVMRLFTNSGVSDVYGLRFLSMGPAVKGGESFDVDITRAATKGYLQGGILSNPALTMITLTDANNRIKIKVDGRVSDDIILTARSYSSSTDLVREIQTRIDDDARVGHLGVAVDWVETEAGEGYLKLTSSTYGSASRIETISSVSNPAYAYLNLAGASTVAGLDVAGTINGEAATGQGLILTGDSDNETTAGLQLEVTLTVEQLAEGIEGTISVTRGIASIVKEMVDNVTKSGDGIVDTKIKSLDKQVANIQKQVKAFDERLAIRRETLARDFMEMEIALSQFQTQSSFLDSQLANINANFAKILGNQ